MRPLVAVGGGASTRSEIALVWVHDRPIMALRVEGWSSRLADQRLDGWRRPGLPEDDRVCDADTPEEAVRWLQQLLPTPTTS